MKETLLTPLFQGSYGLNPGRVEAFTPKFAKKFTNIGEQVVKALKAFAEETGKGIFPAPEHCHKMPREEAEKLEKRLE